MARTGYRERILGARPAGFESVPKTSPMAWLWIATLRANIVNLQRVSAASKREDFRGADLAQEI